MKEGFAEGVNDKYGNKDWCGLKRKLLHVASEVCGYTKGKPRHFETWWWNKDVHVAVCRKIESYLRFGMRKIGRYIVSQKKDAKRAVYTAMDQKAPEAMEKADSCRDGRELFRVVKGLGRRKMLLGLVVLKMKVGQGK